MQRLLIADDHAVVRKGVIQILNDHDHLTEVVEVGTGADLLDQAGRGEWDAIILDLSLPDIHGLDVLDHLHTRYPEVPVLVLSFHSEEQYALRAMRAGASGYLTKNSVADELVKAIGRICSGDTYISTDFAGRLSSGTVPAAELAPHENLSDREFQVLRMLASGRTSTQIATQLGISIKTVTTYRARMLEKMNMTTSADLIRYALEHGLVE